MYEKIRNKLGGRLIAMICGGAALPDELCRFFINIGIPLYQGYGLTETSPVVACNTPSENKPYTIPIHRCIDDTPNTDTIYRVSKKFRCIPSTTKFSLFSH